MTHLRKQALVLYHLYSELLDITYTMCLNFVLLEQIRVYFHNLENKC